jgi:hypothetical protein
MALENNVHLRNVHAGGIAVNRLEPKRVGNHQTYIPVYALTTTALRPPANGATRLRIAEPLVYSLRPTPATT